MKIEQTELPPGWVWTTMGNIADVVGGGTPKTKDPTNFDGGAIPWLTPADLAGYTAKYVGHGARNITQQGLDGSSAKMMPAGTVLFTSRAPIGYVAIASNPICTNQGFKNFVLRESVLPEYVYWWLKGSKDLAESMSSGTTFLELSGAKAKQLPIPLAPLDQQKRIAAEIEKQFSRLDEAVANLKRVKTNLKRYKAAVLKAAVEGKLTEEWRAAQGRANVARGQEPGATKDHPDVEPASKLLDRILAERRAKWEETELAKMKAKGKAPKSDKWKAKYRVPVEPALTGLPELPEGWAWATWDQISNWVTYGFTRPMPHVDEGLPIVTAKHVVDGRIEMEETHKTLSENYEALSDKDRPQPGDILITKDGTIGRAAIVPDHDGFCINQSVAVLWLRSCPIRREYLLAVIDSELVQKPVREKARGVAIKHLSITDFARLPIPIPPMLEQQVIHKEVSAKLSIIASVEASVDVQEIHASRLRQSVLQMAFSGKSDGFKADDIRLSAELMQEKPNSGELG